MDWQYYFFLDKIFFKLFFLKNFFLTFYFSMISFFQQRFFFYKTFSYIFLKKKIETYFFHNFFMHFTFQWFNLINWWLWYMSSWIYLMIWFVRRICSRVQNMNSILPLMSWGFQNMMFITWFDLSITYVQEFNTWVYYSISRF